MFAAVFEAVTLPAEPVADFGDSDSCAEFLLELGVVAGVCATEFFLLAAFLERDVVALLLLGWPPVPRFRFLITSVFKLRGRTTPCNFRNKPQALHSG